jgi:intermembrane space import and assembly protein 40
MQNCFREYPEVYGSELEGDDADNEDDLTADAASPAPAHSESTPAAAYSDSTDASRSSYANEKSSKPSSHGEIGASEKGKLSGERSSKPHTSDSTAENKSKLGLVPDNYKPDARSNEPISESEHMVPKAAHDAGDANTEILQRK